MKKIILLLLISISAYGQTATGKEQSFPYGIRNKLPQTVTTASYLTTMGTDGTEGRILPSSLLSVYNPLISHLEYNNTDKTLWNNGKSDIGSNTSFGYQTLRAITTGELNSAFGLGCLRVTTTGSYNTAIGYQSLNHNIGGSSNIGVGKDVLFDNTSGVGNVGVGNNALYTNESGNYNTAIGLESMYSNASDNNTAIGNGALRSNSFGNDNTAIGFEAGSYLNDDSTPNDDCTYSVFIGSRTRVVDVGLTNQIVIGYGAVSGGSNTVAIGNSSIIANTLYGQVRGGSFVASAAAPVNGVTAGILGEIRAAAGFIYVCSGGTVWTRATLTTY